jgi:hypothetical protein
MTPGNLLAGIIFSSIGLGATIYGKKMGLWKTMVIGITLMVYPYFTSDAVLTTLLGLALTVALFTFRD